MALYQLQKMHPMQLLTIRLYKFLIVYNQKALLFFESKAFLFSGFGMSFLIF